MSEFNNPDPRPGSDDVIIEKPTAGAPYVGGVQPDDVLQGYLGTCYFMAALAAAAATPSVRPIIEQMIETLPHQRFRVWFYDRPDGKSKRAVEITATVLSKFYPKANVWWPVYAQPKIHDTNGGRVREIWPLLAEKAYAVFRGKKDFSQIEGGFPDDALEHITGYKRLRRQPVPNNPSETFRTIVDALRTGHPVTMWTNTHANAVVECNERDRWIRGWYPHGHFTKYTIGEFIKKFVWVAVSGP
jgi:hypothetical protein